MYNKTVFKQTSNVIIKTGRRRGSHRKACSSFRGWVGGFGFSPVNIGLNCAISQPCTILSLFHVKELACFSVSNSIHPGPSIWMLHKTYYYYFRQCLSLSLVFHSGHQFLWKFIFSLYSCLPMLNIFKPYQISIFFLIYHVLLLLQNNLENTNF